MGRQVCQYLAIKILYKLIFILGVYHLYLEERNKPVEEHYIQSFINTPNGGTVIFTCVPALIKLVHEVTSFECDVTFKQVQTLNEWEMVIYYPPLNVVNHCHDSYFTLNFTYW